MTNLSSAQLATLKNDITVINAGVVWDGQTLLQWWNTGQNQPIAEYYQAEAAGPQLVWREDLLLAEVNEAVLYSELLTLSTVELLVYDAMLRSNGGFINAASQNIRDGFSDVLSGPQRSTSRNNVTTAAKRNATNGEVLYATTIDGALVSDIYGDQIVAQNIADARLV